MASIAERSLLQPADIPNRRPRFRSERTTRFTESVIREMSRLATDHNAVNLAQGFPDFPAPQLLKDAARQAIADGVAEAMDDVRANLEAYVWEPVYRPYVRVESGS